MQREIKFRGIAFDTGEFVYGYYVKRTDPHDKSHKIYDPNNGTWHKVKAETVGQYIGLHDNTKWEVLTEEERAEWLQISGKVPSEWKGREIYQGDVVGFIDADGKRRICGTIMYGINVYREVRDDGVIYITGFYTQLKAKSDYNWYCGIVATNLVFGNIHQNMK